MTVSHDITKKKWPAVANIGIKYIAYIIGLVPMKLKKTLQQLTLQKITVICLSMIYVNMLEKR